MKRIALGLIAGAFLIAGIIAFQNSFLLNLSSVHPGMTQREVFQTIGSTEFFETQTDNWYFVRLGPLIVYTINVKIDMRRFMAMDTEGRSGDRVTSVEWKRVLCFDAHEAAKISASLKVAQPESGR